MIKNNTIETITLDEKTLKYRAFENIIYVNNPIDTNFQKLSIFVPETYYEGNSIGNYNLNTAPIFFPNTVGGYMPGAPERAGHSTNLLTSPMLLFMHFYTDIS